MSAKCGIDKGGPTDLDALEPRLLLTSSAFPVPLSPVGPAGSLVYRGASGDSIAAAGETDTFTISLDAGQTVSLLAAPASTLQPTLEFLAPDGASLGLATASAAGGYALLQTLPAAAAGTYTVVVSNVDATTGNYSLALTLNAAIEAETHGGPANDSRPAAQDLDGAFLLLAGGAASRAAVTGSLAAGAEDWYRFSLFDAQVANLALQGGGATTPTLELYDALGHRLAVGGPAGRVGAAVTNFVDPTDNLTSETYYVRISGGVGGDYTLLVLADAAFSAGIPCGQAGMDISRTGVLLGWDAWPAQGKFTASDGTSGDYFGHSVALDGSWALMGAYADSDNGSYAGSAYFFRTDGAAWTQQGKVTASDRASNDYFGYSVALSGAWAIVGAPYDDDKGSSSGAAYLFHYDGAAWVQQSKLVPADGAAGDDFGYRVALSGDWAIVGAYNDDDKGSNSGAAYLYHYDGAAWVQQTKLVPADGAAGDVFGRNVAIDGNIAVVEAPNDDDKGTDTGSVYVYRYDGTAWTQQAKLTRPDTAATDILNRDIAVDGDTIAVGASVSSTSGNGAVHLFRFDGTGWTARARVTPFDGGANDDFAGSIALSGGTLIASAVGDGDKGANSGSVYVYTVNGADWALVSKTLASDGAAYDAFGMDVALDGDTALIGARGDDDKAVNAGSAYILNLAGNDYTVSVHAGDALTISTATPASGAGQFVNDLDPLVKLYNPSGTLVASNDNGAGDGRNALINYTATADGLYTIRVAGATSVPGTFVLQVEGYTPSTPPFRVSAASVAANAVLTTRPATLRVDFNDPPLLSSLQEADLTVNGVPALDVIVVDADTALFTLPVLPDGAYSLAIAAGAVVDLQGTPVDPMTLAFTLDTTAPRVVESSVTASEVLSPGPLVYTARFDEVIPAASLDASDVSLVGAGGGARAPSQFVYDPATRTLTLAWASLPEDDYTLTLLAAPGAFADAAGNPLDGEVAPSTVPSGDGTPGGNFVLHFTLDVDTVPFGLPLTPVGPEGALIYRGSGPGLIGLPDDADRFSIRLDAGQTLAVLVTPAASLQPVVELLDPDGTSLGATAASAAGGYALLQTLPAAAGGTYTIVVRGAGATTGTYTAALTLNAALEAEEYGAPANDSQAAAQDIDASFIPLTGEASRAAVTGHLAAGSVDWFRFSLLDGQSAHLALASTASTAAVLDLYDADGKRLATGVTSEKAEALIAGFVDRTADGVPTAYFAKVSGPAAGDYTLVVTVNAALDTRTTSVSTPRDFPPGGTILTGPAWARLGATEAPADALFRSFGTAIAVDGDQAIVGATRAAYVYRRTGDAWTLQAVLAPSDPTAETYFGVSVDIHGDWAIVGATGANAAAYFFHFDGAAWTQQAEFLALDGEPDSTFGAAVALEGDWAAVGDYWGAGATLADGAVHLYHFDGTAWAPQGKLFDPAGTNNTFFGYSVAIEGDRLAVGYADDADHGSVVLYQRQGLAWTQSAKLTASDTASGDCFGSSVALSGDTILIGAPYDDSTYSNVGAAYLFRYDGTAWTQQAKFLAPDRAAKDRFGSSVALDGQTALVGVPYSGSYAGAAYLYHYNGAAWLAEGKLTAAQPQAGEAFGRAVALTGNRALVTAPGDRGALWTFRTNARDYVLSVRTGDTVTVSTATPAGGPGQFVNDYDPAVQLYSPAGALLASDDNSAPDGRNARLSFTAPADGLYTLRLLNADDSWGACVLSVAGATAAADPFAVSATDIPDRKFLPAAPTTLRLDFSDKLLLASVDPADLTVNGIAATAVTIVDADTVTFALPVLAADADYSVAVAAGAILDLAGRPLQGYTAVFTVDTIPPKIIASSVLESQTLAAGAWVCSLTFSEPLGTYWDSGDIALSGANFGNRAFSRIGIDPAANTVTLECAGLPEDDYTLTLYSGNYRFEDRAGNDLDGERNAATTVPTGNGTAGGNFVLHFTTDIADSLPLPFSTPLMPRSLAGKTAWAGNIQSASDSDTLAFDLAAGNSLTLAASAAADLQLSMTLLAPDGTPIGSAASAPGGSLLLQSIPAATAGTYRAVLTGASATTGLYNLTAWLNAAAESEGYGGPANNSRPAAQDLTGALLPLAGGPADHAALAGALSGASDEDWFSVALTDGQHLSAALARAAALGLSLQLYDAAGSLLATAQNVPGADACLADFADPTANGTPDLYYLRVAGSAASAYALALARGALLETSTGDFADSALGYWPLDEGSGDVAADASANNDGVIRGASWTTRADGGALAFDGVDDFVDLGNPPALQFTGQITLAAWVRFDTLSPAAIWGDIIAHGYSGMGEIFLRQTYGDCEVGTWNGSGTWSASFGIPTASLGQWVHVAGTWADGVWTIYRNGVAVAQSAPGAPGPVLVTDVDWTLGCNGYQDNRFFFGGIDEPLICNRALSAAEIALLAADLPIPPAAEPLAAATPVLGAVSSALDDDSYRVTLRPGDSLILSSATPSAGPAPLLNNLDPALELYNPAGTLIASNDNGAPDGRNAVLAYTALTAGTYLVKLRGAAGSVGEYVLTAQVVPDTTAPAVTVARRLTDDRTPALAGTVDDPNATIDVAVGGLHYAAVNHGDGTWSLADDAIAAPLAWGVHDVVVTATDLAANAAQDASAGELTVYRLIADANFDGTVNLEDFGLLKDNFGQTPRSWSQGDFNGDGLVNLEDFGLLKDHFGLSAPLEAAPTPLAAFPPQVDSDDPDNASLDILDILSAAAPQLVLRAPSWA